ncbi:MAG: DNA-methyltransferase, partial [Acidimicrobiales bacterium]
RVIIASKGRFQRALSAGERQRRGLPHRSTMTNDEFVDVTRDVWRIDAESATRIGHPAPFPVDLPRRLIELYTYVDDLVLDPFAGSGSTLVAAARTGRIGVGYDLDPAYVALCEQRMGEELERLERVGAGDDLSVDERHDVHLAEAVEVGAKVLDIATRRLEAAGFTVDTKKKSVKHPGGVVVFDAVATAADGRRFFIDVAGAFTTVKPGVQRIEAAWRLVGRLAAAAAAPADPVLVLTPALPKRNTEAWKALQSLGPEAAFDMIELMDPDGLDRLAAYGNSALDPLPGFWSTERLS